MEDLWVSDCMSRKVVTCPPDTSLLEVVEELRENSYSCIVIVENERPIGLITERNIMGILSDLLGSQVWESLSVEDFMTVTPPTIDEDRTLMEAISKMRTLQLRQAPVINISGLLVGILTQTDIINGFVEALGEIDD